MPLSYYITQTRCNNNNVTVTFESVLSVVPHHNWSHAKNYYTAHAQRICVWSCSTGRRISPAVEQCLRGERNNPYGCHCDVMVPSSQTLHLGQIKTPNCFLFFSDEKLDNHRRRVRRRLDILIYFLLQFYQKKRKKNLLSLRMNAKILFVYITIHIHVFFFPHCVWCQIGDEGVHPGKKTAVQKKIMAFLMLIFFNWKLFSPPVVSSYPEPRWQFRNFPRTRLYYVWCCPSQPHTKKHDM